MSELDIEIDNNNKKIHLNYSAIDYSCISFSDWKSLNDFVVDLKMAGLKVFGPEDLYENKPKYKFFNK